MERFYYKNILYHQVNHSEFRIKRKIKNIKLFNFFKFLLQLQKQCSDHLRLDISIYNQHRCQPANLFLNCRRTVSPSAPHSVKACGSNSTIHRPSKVTFTPGYGSPKRDFISSSTRILMVPIVTPRNCKCN